mgnify:CR=1 FL=1
MFLMQIKIFSFGLVQGLLFSKNMANCILYGNFMFFAMTPKVTEQFCWDFICEHLWALGIVYGHFTS